MCIIAVRPAGKNIDAETFKNCFENNPDGCGFMYAKNGMVYGKKGIMTYKDFVREEKKIPKDVNVVFHFRISTHGGVTPKLTHPFPLSNSFEKLHKQEWCSEYGIAHNGVFTTVKAPEDESDTEVFISNVLKPLQELCHIKNNLLTDKYYDDIIESAVGGSRLAIMTNTGYIKMYGYGWVNGQDGCYYSNSTYSYGKCKSYVNYDYSRKNKNGYGSFSETEKNVLVMTIGRDDVDNVCPPDYLFTDGVSFMDENGDVYYFDEISTCFRKSVYRANAIFNKEEAFLINTRGYVYDE